MSPETVQTNSAANEVGLDFDMSEAFEQAVETPSVLRACCVLEEKVAEIKALRQEQEEQQRNGGSVASDVIARINEKEEAVRQELEGLPQTDDVKALSQTLDSPSQASAGVDVGVAKDYASGASNSLSTPEAEKVTTVTREPQKSSPEEAGSGATFSAAAASEPALASSRQESTSSFVSNEGSLSAAGEVAGPQTTQELRPEPAAADKLQGLERESVAEKAVGLEATASKDAARPVGALADSLPRQDTSPVSARVEPVQRQQVRIAADPTGQPQSSAAPREASPQTRSMDMPRQGGGVASSARPAEPAAVTAAGNVAYRAQEPSAQAPKQSEPMRRIQPDSKPEPQTNRFVRSAAVAHSTSMARSVSSRGSSVIESPLAKERTARTAGRLSAQQSSGVQRTPAQTKVGAAPGVRAITRQLPPALTRSSKPQAALKRAAVQLSAAARRSRLVAAARIASRSIHPTAQKRIQALVRQLRALSPKEIKNLLRAGVGKKAELRAAGAIKQRAQKILERLKDRPIKEVLKMRGLRQPHSERARKAERLLSARERMARREVRSHLRGLEQRLKRVLNPRSLIYKRLTTELTPSDLERLVSILGGARALRGLKRRQKSGNISSVVEADVSGGFMRELSAAAGAAGKVSSSSGESESGGAGGAGADQGEAVEESANQESTLVADGATPSATLTTFIMKEEDRPSSPAAQ